MIADSQCTTDLRADSEITASAVLSMLSFFQKIIVILSADMAVAASWAVWAAAGSVLPADVFVGEVEVDR